MAAAAEVIYQGDLAHARVAATQMLPLNQDNEDPSQPEEAFDQTDDDLVRQGDASRASDEAANLAGGLDNRSPMRPDSRSSSDRSSQIQQLGRSSSSSKEEDEADLWHRRLGHPGIEAMRHLEATSIGKSLPGPKQAHCEVCARGKASRDISRQRPRFLPGLPGESWTLDLHYPRTRA